MRSASSLSPVTVVGISVGLALCANSAWLSWRFFTGLEAATASVVRSQEIRTNLKALTAAALAMESHERGFMLTARPELLESLKEAVANMNTHSGLLSAATPEDLLRRTHCGELTPLVERRVALARAFLDRRSNDGLAGAGMSAVTNSSIEATDQIQMVANCVGEAEQRAITQRLAEADRSTVAIRWLGLIGGTAGLLLLGRLFTLLVSEIGAGRRTSRRLSDVTSKTSAFTKALDEHAIVVITDRHHTITHVNDKYCAISKYSREELLGQDINITRSGHHSEAFLKEMYETIQTGRTWQGEIKNRAKDGTFYWVAATIVPLLDAHGVPELYFSIRADISTRKQNEASLAGHEAWLQLALDSGDMGAWEFDLKGQMTSRTLRHDQIFGYESFLPHWDVRFFLAHVVPEDRERVRRALKEARHTDRFHLECRILWPDQSLHWISLEGRRYRDGNGVPRKVIGIVADISARKDTEEQLARLNSELVARAAALDVANQELESFSYSVSHDLRAPLRSIDGFSQVLLEDYSGVLDESGKDCLRRVRKASAAMGELIDALLLLAGVSRRSLCRHPVDLSAIATAHATALRRTQPDKLVEFVITPGMVVDGDQALLKIVLANLLDNAWKFTGRCAEPVIEVGCFDRDRESVHFVRDNGAGFDMAYADRLFGAFQRLHREDEFAGTGVGLATVRRIITRHGGRVWAEAEVGRGATFYFALANRTDGAQESTAQ